MACAALVNPCAYVLDILQRYCDASSTSQMGLTRAFTLNLHVCVRVFVYTLVQTEENEEKNKSIADTKAVLTAETGTSCREKEFISEV